MFNGWPINKLMKSIVILYKSQNDYQQLPLFNGKDALTLTKQAFEGIDCLKNVEIKTIEGAKSLGDVLELMCEAAKNAQAENVVFSYADCPFINKNLTEKILDAHIKYKAEYTFADGYPYGFSPEVINAGTLNILKELSKTTQNGLGQKLMDRESLFNLIKTDINSFEIETVLADTDWRLYRFAFHCGKYENYSACRSLFEVKNTDDVEELSKLASENPHIIKTVPGFYNIQICDGINADSIYLPYKSAYEAKNKLSPVNNKNNMSYENFSRLIEKINDFSKEAVIGLSAWGEPLNHPDFAKIIEKVLSYKGLSVFIETDGFNVTEEIAACLGKINENACNRTNGWKKLMVAVTMDSVTEEKYEELHGCKGLQKAKNAVEMLEKYIPGCVYPMFTRINQNEPELEAFFRFWNEKDSPSKGECIIQKYDNFAGLLPEWKPADLSPLDRNVCWHIRRDMTIYSNGDVPLCRTCLYENIGGNVFEQSLEEIWKKSDDLIKDHMNNKFNNKCGKCDEWYTFNF